MGLSASSLPYVPLDPLQNLKLPINAPAETCGAPPGLCLPPPQGPAWPLISATYYTLTFPGKLLEGLLVSGWMCVHNYLFRIVLQGPLNRCHVILENHQGYPLVVTFGARFYDNNHVYSSWSLSGHDFSYSYQSIIPNPSGQKYWNVVRLLGQTKIDPLIMQIILRVASD